LLNVLGHQKLFLSKGEKLMPFYPPLRRAPFTDETRIRCAERLLRLRQQLHSQIPTRKNRDTLLLATWNIRDFDSNKFGHGPRLPESFF
jgi:hypothetical protein